MVASIDTLLIGVIAEEKNDYEVLYELTSKLLNESQFSFKHFFGHGCGKVRRKCSAWAQQLLSKGCHLLVVIHDLDKRDEAELRTQLESSIKGFSFSKTIVLIPKEEIEAWLLSDINALKKVFKLKNTPSIPLNPESIDSPKEYLSRLVSRNSQTDYLNTIHNRKIAKELDLNNLKRRCNSFRPYPKFLKQT